MLRCCSVLLACLSQGWGKANARADLRWQPQPQLSTYPYTSNRPADDTGAKAGIAKRQHTPSVSVHSALQALRAPAVASAARTHIAHAALTQAAPDLVEYPLGSPASLAADRSAADSANSEASNAHTPRHTTTGFQPKWVATRAAPPGRECSVDVDLRRLQHDYSVFFATPKRRNDSDALLVRVGAHLWSQLLLPLRQKCSYIRFTGAMPYMAPLAHYERPERHGKSVHERVFGVPSANKAAAAVAKGDGGKADDRLLTSTDGRGRRSLAKPSVQGPGHARMAMVFMANSPEALRHQLHRFALHFMTHWLYAKANGYNVFVYVHQLPKPTHLQHSFTYFLKAPAIQVR